MSGRLDGRVALVTGAGRGIGRAIAVKLAAEGARVVINDMDRTPADETIDTITAVGGSAVACVGSVTAPDFPERFVDTARETYGGIDIVVNNAGYTWDAVVQKTSDEQWAQMMDVHVGAPFRILRAAQPHIAAAAKRELAASGLPHCRKVVNISSLAGVAGNAGQAAYASGKAAVTGLTRTLAKEWGRYNVTVNAVAFGLIGTRLTADIDEGNQIVVDGRAIPVGVNSRLLEAARAEIPLGRAGTLADAAGAVWTLCTPESDYITGQTLVCAGGWNG